MKVAKIFIMFVPQGEQIQIRNLTSKIIQNLFYTYEGYPATKVRKIRSHAKEQSMIITTNLEQDYDLTFYFDDAPEITFIFPKAVKRRTNKLQYAYFFVKITEKENRHILEDDPEGEQLYFSE